MFQYKMTMSANFSSMQMFLRQKDPVQSWPVQIGQCKVETNQPELWSTYQKPEPVVLSNEKLTKIEAGLSLTLPKYALHLGY